MIRPFLKTVTVTGADDSVSVVLLREIALMFPFVEFGILVSKGSMTDRQERSRFPSRYWLEELLQTYKKNDDSGTRFSIHICGPWVQEILMGDWPQELEVLAPIASRWQLNTHGKPHTVNSIPFVDLARHMTGEGREIIFQYDGVNTQGLHLAREEGLKVSALFDLSHGSGVLPDVWPRPLKGVDVGYAGGLSLTNIEKQLPIIQQASQGRTIWIDAETHLRSTRDHRFDLALVVRFVRACAPWSVAPPSVCSLYG